MELRFSDDFLKALEFSRDEAIRTGWHNISPDHIMLGILRLENDLIYEILGAVGVQAAEFKSSLDDAVFVDEPVAWDERNSVALSPSASSFLQHACLESRRCGSPVVEPLHFLLAACRISGPYCHDFLAERSISLRDLVEASGLPWEEYGIGNAGVSVEGAASTEGATAVATEGATTVISTGDSSSVISTGAKRRGEISSPSSPSSPASSVIDPLLLAEQIEQRLRAGYTTGNPIVS